MATAARELANLIKGADSSNREVAVALAGGATPAPVYRQLARDDTIPWHRVAVYFGDERCVPPDDPASNYHMAMETLIEPAAIASHRVHRIEAESDDREAAADAYARVFPERLDVLILGIGEDGHTASLFPESGALRESNRKVVAVQGPKVPHERITITPVVIEMAANVVVLATGSVKASAVARALDGSDDVYHCPARLARNSVWVLDRDAAADLGAAP